MTRRRRVFVVSAVMGILLLGAEIAARFLEPGLSSSGSWPKGWMAQQYDVVSQHAGGEPVDVVFAGSSMMKQGVDAELYSKRTGLASLNLALPASTNIMLEPWLMNVVVPKLSPRVVVIGVASRDFNDNADGPQRAVKALTGAPGYRNLVADDWLTGADRVASRHSTLLRVRRSLREPSNLLRAAATRRPPVPRRPCPPASPSSERYVVDRTVARYPKTVLKDYSAGGPQTRALIDTIEGLRRHGIEVVLLAMPSSSDYASLHPDPERDVAEFEAAFRRVIEKTRATIIDGTSLSSKDVFRDAIHLNCEGRRRFTTAIAEHWPGVAR